MDISTNSGKKPSHIIGIGASANGLEALEQVFANYKSRDDVAFVIIQHLSPDYKSLMPELLTKFSSMPVHKIEDGMEVMAGNIYVIAPNRNVKIFHNKLISEKIDDRDSGMLNLPIDIFFRSLAEDQKDRAIAIVLSGTGSDGSRGVRFIKELGGMTIAQEPASTKFDSMPKSAISTGMIDYVLPPNEIPSQLHAYLRHPLVAKHEDKETFVVQDSSLTRVFSLLRENHNVDFTHYKPNTIMRRIERRITITQCTDIQQYVNLLSKNRDELELLFQELLIGVTSFFRDQKVFDALQESIIPELIETALENKVGNKEIRIWSAGCSTGEEAYTLAMIVTEKIRSLGVNCSVKIFATDIDARAIEKASTGAFPSSLVADVPAYLRDKYFRAVDDEYLVSREIRETIVFAQHDILRDPPFTNIDLVTCRNLLIYLQPVLQTKVLELFSFSLREGATLVLGESESIGDHDDLFESRESKLKIFTAKGRRTGLRSFAPAMVRQPTMHGSRDFVLKSEKQAEHISELRIQNALIETLVTHRLLPLTIIVDRDLNASHVYGESSELLRYSLGRIEHDINSVVIRDLSLPVSAGLKKAIKTNEPVSLSNVSVKSDSGALKTVDIQIFPCIGNSVSRHYLLLLKDNQASQSGKSEQLEYNA